MSGLAAAVGWWALAGVALAVTPPVRRMAVALLVRHRFQGLCLRTSLRTQRGRLPLVVHTRRAGAAVVMLVWCRSGMSEELFEDYRAEITAACYARDVAISRHPRWGHLLVVDVEL